MPEAVPEPQPGRAQRRARWRAAWIAFFVFFNVLAALPTLGTPSAERLQRPFERAELRRWSGLFVALGLDVPPERLVPWYLWLSGGLAELREIALSPIAGWMSLTQTSQRWTLFAAPREYRSRLQISAHSADTDELLYESGNSEHDWSAGLLGYRRIRAAYYPSAAGPPPTYARLCERLSQQIFAERPRVERVRCALERRRVGVPGESADETREERDVIELSRPGG